MKCGSVTGTGAAIEVQLDFQPRLIEVYNVTAPASGVWMEGMADASAFKRVTAGDATLITSNGITPGIDGSEFGFTIGTDADLNTAAELIRWVAHE